jgi:transcription elongation factor GreA
LNKTVFLPPPFRRQEFSFLQQTNEKECCIMVERIPMSKKGYLQLKKELERLEKTERPDVVKAIETARAHGDLSENAEYHAAKERQGLIEGRIAELKSKIGLAEVIDCTKVGTARAVFGTVITLMDMDTDEEVTYQLLGPEEADVKNGSISVLSPIGRSILGKAVGDEVNVKTPGGLREFEVIDIQAGTFC